MDRAANNNRIPRPGSRKRPLQSQSGTLPVPPLAQAQLPPTSRPPKRHRPNEKKTATTATAIAKKRKTASVSSTNKATNATTGNATVTTPATTAATTATATTAAHATISTPNIYDAMLGEISDLTRAAQEAQSCGRLKMASTYQLLVHARLVGLGKRFDRFLSTGQIIRKEQQTAVSHSNSASSSPESIGAAKGTGAGTGTSTSSTHAHPNTNGNASAPPGPGESIRTAQAALAKILPSGVDLDYTMMEHLARAAMELHNRRTGRGLLHEKEMERKNLLLERDRKLTRDGIKSSNSNSNSNSNTTRTAGNAHATPATPTTANTSTTATAATPSSSAGVAWSTIEKQKCMKAAELNGMDAISKIARAVGTRTEVEVKAHLRNINGMKKVERELNKGNSGSGGSSGTGNQGSASGESNASVANAYDGGTGDVTGSVQANAVNNNSDGNTSAAGPSLPGTPEKKKGRGKKPPPRAMLTVPNTTFDAKKMLFEPI
jgi:hypothetical protein